ncbi:MAG: protein phosphatase 2C domain-containing protein [Polyangiaceae bacterium]|nr:protein phosphatase 2C domain-containing protein [Polyangiaceae bacterium]
MLTPRRDVPLRVIAAGETHPGGRPHNEDVVLVRRDLDLYAVADGAGEQQAGSVASAVATTAVCHHFEKSKTGFAMLPEIDGLGLPSAARRLATAIQRANREVLEVAKSSTRHKGMGTTIAAVVPSADRRAIHVAHVGDSRCYRYRAGRLDMLTRDHVLLNDVLETRPDLSDQEAARLPRNAVTNALGMNERLRVSVGSYEVAPGDRYILCTDGLTDTLDDGLIGEIMERAKAPADQVRLLIDTACENHARDNVAVVVLAFATGSTGPGVAADKPRSDRPRKSDVPRAPAERKSDRGRTSRSPRPEPEPLRRTLTPASSSGEGPEAEIVFVRAEARSPRDSTPMIHVLPADAGNADVVTAVQDFVDTAVPPPRGPLDTLDFTTDDQVRCASCFSPLDPAATFCPHCGASRKP